MCSRNSKGHGEPQATTWELARKEGVEDLFDLVIRDSAARVRHFQTGIGVVLGIRRTIPERAECQGIAHTRMVPVSDPSWLHPVRLAMGHNGHSSLSERHFEGRPRARMGVTRLSRIRRDAPWA